MEREVIVLWYLREKLPVAQLKAYSLTADNVLMAAYNVQTRISGDPLSKYWATMGQKAKYQIIDEFVDFLVKLEPIEFPTAGILTGSHPTSLLPAQTYNLLNIPEPTIQVFSADTTKPSTDPQITRNRTGLDLIGFLTSNVELWIQDEVRRNRDKLSVTVAACLEKLLAMLKDLNDEGAFGSQPFPILLHHHEPRNIMVSPASGFWRITGIFDWDDAVALPRPLTRKPPKWIWKHPPSWTGYLDDDQFQDPELSDENSLSKNTLMRKLRRCFLGTKQMPMGAGDG